MAFCILDYSKIILMKFKVFLCLFLFSFSAFYAQEDVVKLLHRNPEFKNNQNAFLFADKVKLRQEPNTGSTVLELLSIASEITVLEKSPTTFLFNGLDWNWYKVKYQNKTGYIVGGLIALDKQTVASTTYLVTLKKKGEEDLILIRMLDENKQYIEYEGDYHTDHAFSITALKNKGVPNVKNILYVDYHAEACGVNGGGYYLFNNGERLTKAVDLYSMSEAGLFSVTESVVFPEDAKGVKNKITLVREHTTTDEDSQKTETSIASKAYAWEGKELKLE